MEPTASAAYRFGDVLALARRSWTLQMEREVEARGFPDYRISDAGAVRLLMRGPTPVGHLGYVLGVTRQAARKVVQGLEQRGLATTEPDPDDARKLNVRLTNSGRHYGRVLISVIEQLNRDLANRVPPDVLAAADVALRAAVDDQRLARTVAQIPPPPAPPPA